jgi:hypothetical protein
LRNLEQCVDRGVTSLREKEILSFSLRYSRILSKVQVQLIGVKFGPSLYGKKTYIEGILAYGAEQKNIWILKINNEDLHDMYSSLNILVS